MGLISHICLLVPQVLNGILAALRGSDSTDTEWNPAYFEAEIQLLSPIHNLSKFSSLEWRDSNIIV